MYHEYIDKETIPEKRAIAHLNLGHIFMHRKNFKEAEDQLYWAVHLGIIGRGNADLGDLAAVCLGQPNRAVRFYEKALDAEEWRVMSPLGYLYLNIENDPDKAEKIWLEAVNKGVVDAYVQLGQFYDLHKGDYQKAEKYYLLADKAHHRNAAEMLNELRMKMVHKSPT